MSRLLPILLAAACSAPDATELFTTLDLTVAPDAAPANDEFSAVADVAERTLHVAVERLADEAFAQTLVDAWDRGVDVRVVVDAQQADAPGVPIVEDAGIPLQRADDGIAYFDFGTNRDVAWSGDQTVMTHAFVVADGVEVAMATRAGDVGPGTRLVFAGHSEDLGEDLVQEHIQVFGGTDATATTAFSAMAKSIVDTRWAYPTQDDEILEVWFNPQERGVKRIIDAIYRARSSVRVMSADVADEGLARALQRKAEDGFDVEVLVGNTFGASSSALSDVLRNQAPDVPLLQQVAIDDPLPTIVFVDFDRARDGRYHMPMVYVLTHPIWSAARLYADVEVLNDQLVDGALYVIGAHGQPTGLQQDLAEIYKDQRALAEVLR